MKCLNHSESDAVGACVYCGKLFCSICLVEVNGKNYCKADIEKMLAEATIRKTAEPQIQHILVTNTTATPERGARKTAVMALSIIFGIIGILWTFFGPMAMFFIGLSQAVDSSVRENSGVDLANSSVKIVLSILFIIAAMVMALVASGRKTSKLKTIVLGSLVIVMGIVSTWLLQYVSGPVFTLCGILLLAEGTMNAKVASS